MLRLLTLAGASLLVLPALADGPSYDYIEGSYQRVELDDSMFDIDGDGFGIAGSFEIGDQWHLFAGYDTTDFDFDVDLDEIVLGGGLHMALSPNLDLVANLAYVRLDASAMGFSVDDDGFGASLGLRALAADRLELAGFIDYVDLDDSGDDTAVRGEAWYLFTDSFALGFSIGAGDDVTRYGLGARVYFD
ncbi:MAG: hypothetical protein R3288_01860 [Woeseiaceae bacterium]|nr:hypothetical protein [Woeseiaceae bacterium]